MITKLITVSISNAEGFTYQWIVQSASNCTGFSTNQILNIGTINSNYESIELEVVYPEDCEELIIKIVLYENGSVCEFLEFDIINDEVHEDKHWECNGEGEEYICEQILGLPYLSTHYNSYTDCINCNNCACGITSPCRSLGFSGIYTCPDFPGGNGLLTITLISSSQPYIPVTINSISIDGIIIENCTTNCELSTIGSTYTINLTLAAGTHNVLLNISAEDNLCPINPIIVSVNCQYGGTGDITVSGDLYCCQEIEAFGAGSIGNVGGLNCYVLYYGTNIDENEDIVIDFGANTISDKLEVYKGVIDCQSIANDTVSIDNLVASIPYIGNVLHCRNIEPCFLPAVGTANEQRNDVQQGIREFSGIYSGQTGITYANRSLFSNPDFADELMGSVSATHTIVGSYPDYAGSYSNPGMGGPNSGIARLRVPGGTYANDDKKLTLVVHNNNAENYSPDCPPVCDGTNQGSCCQGNATAWKLFVHCPTCPNCDQIVRVSSECSLSAGNIKVTVVSGSFIAPITMTITPSNIGTMSLFDNSPLYIYNDDTNTSYLVIQHTTYLSVNIPDNVSAVTHFDIFTDVSGNSMDLNNDTWTIVITDSQGCVAQVTDDVECDCLITYNVIGEDQLCKDEDLNLNIQLIDSSCLNSEGSIINIDITPSSAPIAIDYNVTATNMITIYNTSTLVSGQYDITFSFICPDGCYLENVTAQVNVYDWQCNITGVVVDTTCGVASGSIALTLCSGQSVVSWLDNGSTSLTRTNLSGGIYTVVISDEYGCEKEYNYVVNDSTTLSVNMDSYNIECSDTVVSSLFFYVVSGTPDYNLDIYVVSGTNYVLIYNDTDYDTEDPILSASVTGGFVAGNYKAMFTDASGCVVDYLFTITRTYPPNLSIFPSVSSCNLSNGFIRVYTSTYITGTNVIYYAQGNQTCDYVQSYGQIVPYNNGDIYVDIIALVSGQYTVCVTNTRTGCCKCIQTIVSNYGNPPAEPIVVNPTICIGNSVNLLSYTGGSTPYVFCNSGSSVKIYDSNLVLIYNGSTGAGSPIVAPTITTTYYVSCNNACASALVPIIVTVEPLPNGGAELLGDFCKNNLNHILSNSCSSPQSHYLYFGNIVNGNTFNVSLLEPFIIEDDNINPQVISMSYICGSGTCSVSYPVTLSFWESPIIETQSLSFCNNTSITYSMLQSAILPLNPIYAGYTIQNIFIYSDINCSILQSFPFVLSGSTTKYAEVQTQLPGAGNSVCMSECVPITINVSPIVNLPITPTITCNGNNTYNVQLVNSGVGYNSPTGHIWTWNNLLQIGELDYVLVKNNVSPGTVTAAVVYTGTPCLANGSITLTLPLFPIINAEPDHTYCKNDPSTSITLSILNASYSNIVATPYSGAAIVGNTIYPNLTVVGTTVITVTAQNSVGCTVTDTFNIVVENCDPCETCVWSLTNLNTQDSALYFSGLTIAGVNPTAYVIAIRPVMENTCVTEPIAYICLGTCAAENMDFLDVPIINIITPGWTLPLNPGQYNLSLESASGGSNPSLYAGCIADCCGTIINIQCADCTLSDSFSAVLTEETYVVYKACVPCGPSDPKCYKLKFNAGGTAPDKIEVYTNVNLTGTPIYDSGWSNYKLNWQVIKLSLPNTFYDLNASDKCINNITEFWIKITSYSPSSTGSETTTWSLDTECCNCLTNCPPIDYPCIESITENIAATGTYTVVSKNMNAANAVLCTGCLSYCWNADLGTISTAGVNSDICGKITIPDYTNIYDCGNVSTTVHAIGFNSCPNGKQYLNGLTTSWDNINYIYTFNFSASAEATIMKTFLDNIINPTAVANPFSVRLNLSYFNTLTTCGDGTSQPLLVVPIGCFVTSADTAFTTITLINPNTITIAFSQNPYTIPTYCIDDDCLYVGGGVVTNTISVSGFIQIELQASQSKKAFQVYNFYHYGLFSDECKQGARYRFNMTDTNYVDPDKWVLSTWKNDTQYCVSAVGVLTLTGNQIIQYGDTYTTSADVVADIANIATFLEVASGSLSVHPNAKKGAGNCFTGS